MNCFEWQSQSSDYLDGTLIGARKREADGHVETCRECSERYKRYRVILSALASQPRSTLPIPIRKSPLTATLPRRPGSWWKHLRGRWETTPWYLRTTLEGLLIVFLVLIGISAGPRLRYLYERRMEKNMAEMVEASLLHPEGETGAIPLARGKALPGDAAAVPEEMAEAGDAGDSGDSADGADSGESGDSDDSAGSSGDDSEIRVGRSEIWRFNVKTDSPREFRAKIVQILTELHAGAQGASPGGIEVPGGIQFDLIASRDLVPELKHRLEKIAPVAPAELAKSPAGETFTWYKRKSTVSIPEGKSRVVIWLSQI